MFEDYPDLLTVEEARKALKIGKSTMYRLLKEGVIKHLHTGRAIKIPKRYLIDFIETECYNNATQQQAIRPVIKGGQIT